MPAILASAAILLGGALAPAGVAFAAAPATTGSAASPALPKRSCRDHEQPCTRSRVARGVLLGVGAVGAGLATSLLFGIGDRYGQSDPATAFIGGGIIAGTGALLGMALGWLSRDRPGALDRVRPSTVGLDYEFAEPAALDETAPHAMNLRYAPTYRFSAGSRIRLFGHVGGSLWTRREVDPRPQFNTPIPGQQGTAPIVARERQLSLGVGVDLAVALPYPLLKRSKRLGWTELRFRPQAQIRRDTLDVGQASERVVERTMLLPLTAGVRWHLSARQRFTFYLGPRFDVVSFSDLGDRKLRRGGAMIGPFYSAAWYDIDLPHTLRPRNDGRMRAAAVNSQLSVGYVHSRFDGRGLNVGPVVGFLGPVHARWQTRVRPKGWPVALQMGAALVIGGGVGGNVSLGLALPDLGHTTKAAAR